VHEVGAYRAHVDAAVLDLLEHADAATLATITPLVVLGLHHEQQHQELALMDVLHLFSRNEAWDPSLRARSAAASAPSVDAVAAGWIDVDGGVVEIGHRPTPVDADPFCAFAFDNEGPAHRVLLDDFRLATRPVTCGEMAAFVADDGYRRPELWLSDGWAAVCSRGWDAPLYWERDGDGWTTRTLDGRVAVDLDAPIVHVSHYEADAYARWAGARLPTEHEWEHAARDLPMAGNLLVDVATDALRPAAVTGPVTASPSAMFGDVWEWTASAYLPYPRFSPAPGAVGEYNGKFMSGQMVLRGGSFATPVDHVRSTYRNFFPPHARWVFAGLRLAMDA
jgi:ergothioneine biosynthesis protein EgtB